MRTRKKRKRKQKTNKGNNEIITKHSAYEKNCVSKMVNKNNEKVRKDKNNSANKK